MKKILVYTDGSCKQNPGKGGWSCILFLQGLKKKIHGNYALCTNNQMELLGTIYALKYLKKPSEIKIITDSKYVKEGINCWIHLWKYNKLFYIKFPEFKKNKLLWRTLYKICKKKKTFNKLVLD